MFKHEKQLFHPVEVERPNPQYAALLQEQLGGGNGLPGRWVRAVDSPTTFKFC